MAKRGRPKNPKGVGSVNVSLRIDKSVLQGLKKAAREKRHGNVSREVTSRLRQSFAFKKEEEPALRALCYLISEIKKQVSPPDVALYGLTLLTGQPLRIPNPWGVWRSNPFFYAAFKHAISRLLDALTPPGEIIAPDLSGLTWERTADDFLKPYVDSFASPEKLGDQAADHVLLTLRTVSEWSHDEREQRRKSLLDAGMDWVDEQFYSMPDVARDLAVNPKLTGEWVLK